jgi:hypothetical protein
MHDSAQKLNEAYALFKHTGVYVKEAQTVGEASVAERLAVLYH